MEKLTREEKLCIKAYVKMAFVKEWYKPTDIEIARMFDIFKTYENLTSIENLINKEWEKWGTK